MYLIIYYISYLVFPFIVLIALFFYKIKDKAARLAFGILIFLSLCFIYARFIEPKMLKINYEKIIFQEEEKKSAIKIALFSDLHLGVYKNGVSLERIVREVNEASPDIILIPGDFVFKLSPENIEKSFAALSNLKAPRYAVFGNHDVGIPGEDVSETLENILRKYKVTVLENRYEEITIKGHDIAIVGLSELWQKKVNFEILKEIPEDKFSIVLAHNPDAVYEFPNNARVDLVVAGHAHGGQIRLPWVYKLAIPCEHGFDKGLHLINDMKVYVTPGIGMTGLPLRFLMPPEIDFLEVN